MGLKTKIKLGAIVLGIVVVIAIVFAIYLAMPDTVAVVDDGIKTNNYSREDFYTKYLDLKLEQEEAEKDENAEKLSQSVLNYGQNNGSAVTKNDWTAQIEEKSKEAAEYKTLAKQAPINGSDFLYEYQSSTLWSVYKPDQQTMTAQGCFYFAICAAITNKTGYWYTVKDCITDLGGVVTLHNNVYVVTNSPIPSLEGNIGQANKIFTASKSGITAEEVGVNDLEKVLSGGNIAIVYAKGGSKGILSSGGVHWLCCVGMDSSNYYFLNNGSRGTAVSKDTYNKITKGHVFKLNNTVACNK